MRSRHQLGHRKMPPGISSSTFSFLPGRIPRISFFRARYRRTRTRTLSPSIDEGKKQVEEAAAEAATMRCCLASFLSEASRALASNPARALGAVSRREQAPGALLVPAGAGRWERPERSDSGIVWRKMARPRCLGKRRQRLCEKKLCSPSQALLRSRSNSFLLSRIVPASSPQFQCAPTHNADCPLDPPHVPPGAINRKRGAIPFRRAPGFSIVPRETRR